MFRPCDKWFCNPAHFNHSGTRVYATKFERQGGQVKRRAGVGSRKKRVSRVSGVWGRPWRAGG